MFQKLVVFTFSHTTALATKFDIDEKKNKVNPGSKFDTHCSMLDTKFHYNRPTLLGKKIFEGFFIIYGRCSHLDHVSQNPEQTFVSPPHKGTI